MKYHHHGCRLACGALIMLTLCCAAPAQDQYKEGMPSDSGNLKYKVDRSFAGSLREDWRKQELVAGTAFDTTAKPVDLPVAPIQTPGDTNRQQLFSRSKLLAAPPQAKPPARPPVPLPETSQTRDASIKTAAFSYFEAPVKMDYNVNLRTPLGKQVDNRAIGSWWERASQRDYETCLEEAKLYRKQMNLNDWGYAFLLYKLGESIYGGSVSDANLFTWFALLKSGYGARIGYNAEQVFLLLPFNGKLYATPHFSMEGKDYYLISFAGPSAPVGSVLLYKGGYPGATRALELKVSSAPRIARIEIERDYTFSFAGQEISVAAKPNKPLVDYFNKYPQTDLEIYFSAALSPEAGNSLIEALKPRLAGMSEAEAVAFLLAFAQSLPYKTDAQQFGHERYLFPEEVLYYGFSDCEDRSALFAWLVRSLAGLEVVGLDYPGHVATAVKFNNDLPGDSVLYKGRKYLICDPTYLNAAPGMCQPRFQEQKPKIIAVKA
jgi:hypothetical protein